MKFIIRNTCEPHFYDAILQGLKLSANCYVYYFTLYIHDAG